MKNKIVIDIRMLNHSGISIYIENTVFEIVNHYRKSNFIFLVNPKSNHSFFLEKLVFNNYKIIYINSSIYSLKEQFEIYFKLFQYQIDFFWSPHYTIPIFLRTKILVTIHDVWHLVDNSFDKLLKRIYAKIIFFFIGFKKANIIAVSNFTKNEILKYTNIKKNISVIKHGLEQKWISTKSYKLNYDILYVGNIRNHKNINLLIQSFIKTGLKNSKLLLIGKNNSHINENFYDKMNIEFVGETNQNNLISYYNNARLLVLPSSYEGFGFTPLEAMACECPVLVSDIPSLKEVCKDGAFYFDLNVENDLKNKILYLIENETACDELLFKGKKIINKYNWSKTVNETIKKIDKLL